MDNTEQARTEYITQQKLWLKNSGVRKGSYVTVMQKAESHQSGWQDVWSDAMNAFVSKTGKVVKPDDILGVIVDFQESCPDTAWTVWALPFFVLGVVDE